MARRGVRSTDSFLYVTRYPQGDEGDIEKFVILHRSASVEASDDYEEGERPLFSCAGLDRAIRLAHVLDQREWRTEYGVIVDERLLDATPPKQPDKEVP